MPDRKEEILDVAEDLLLTRGYSAFSYQDIAERLGIKKASLHHHFATKEDLGVALCDRFLAQNQSIIDECATRDASATEMLDLYLSHTAALAESADRCCPAGVLKAEFTALPGRVQAKVDEISRWMHECTTRMLARGRESGEFAFEGEPADQAWLLMATLQGSLLSARVHGTPVYDAIAKQLRSQLTS